MEIIVSILPYILLLLSTLLSCPFIIMKKKKQSAQSKHLVAAANSYSKLPPGSMGWPYIGETLQLYSQDPNIFFAAKQKRSRHKSHRLSYTHSYTILAYICFSRYGEIFKSHILGCPCIMVSSPEAARFVLVTHAHLFRPTYPKSKEKLIGPSAIFFHQGNYHTQLRKLVQSSLSPETIQKRIPEIEAIASSTLESWVSSRTVINTFQEMKKVTFSILGQFQLFNMKFCFLTKLIDKHASLAALSISCYNLFWSMIVLQSLDKCSIGVRVLTEQTMI